MNESYTPEESGARSREALLLDTLICLPKNENGEFDFDWYNCVPDWVRTNKKIGPLEAREKLFQDCASFIEDLSGFYPCSDNIQSAIWHFERNVEDILHDEVDKKLVAKAIIETMENEEIEFDRADLEKKFEEVVAEHNLFLESYKDMPEDAFEEMQPEQKNNDLKFYTLNELGDREPPEFIVEGIFPQKGVAIIGGVSGSMKSFLMVGVGLSIALGQNLGNQKVKQAPVLYLLNEGQAGFYHRCAAWHKFHKRKMLEDFRVAEMTPNLMRDETIEPFTKLADSLNFRPGLIVIDTFSKASIGGDDNSTSDMALAIQSAYRLAQHFDSLVVLIDHVGKDPKRGLRGAYAKYANADMVGMVTKSGETVSLKTVKQKDAEDGLTFDFKIDTQEMSHGKKTVSIPVLSLGKSGRLPRQKDFIVMNLGLDGPIVRKILSEKFVGKFGAGKQKSFNEQVRRLKNSGEIKEVDGVIHLKEK